MNATVSTAARVSALAKFLELKKSEYCEIEQSTHDETSFEYGRAEYLVLTDDEADDKARDYIADLLWAFNASFLASETGFDEIIFTALQSKCEGANDSFRSLVDKSCGLDSFAESAVSADGRGHFLAQYDGDENESGKFFIYRTN